MAYTFAEGLVDTILSYLESNLPAKLDAIDTQLDDGITLRDPVAYLRRDPLDPRAITTCPVVFAIVPRTVLLQWRETAARQSHQTLIYLVEQHSDPEELRKRMYRYGRAVWETLVDGHFDSSLVWSIGIGTPPVIDFSETLTSRNISMADVRLDIIFEGPETE
tara:strand:+ start:13383 stop:13871 length:489 start_codon:yes stop_codon:yes gene_type:complete